MTPETLRELIGQRIALQRQRNDILQGFSGLDSQKLGNPAALMGLVPRLGELKEAFVMTQKIEALSDEIIGGFIQLNLSKEGGGNG